MRLNPEMALEDFREAERLNPRSLPALQNQAYLLTEKLGRANEAIAVLSRVLAQRPNYTPSLVDRGLQHARQGHADQALVDVRKAVELDGRPIILYMAAAALARLSSIEPSHGKEAITLLVTALRAGQYGPAEIEADRDFDGIREWPEFRAVIEAARVLKSAERR